MMSDGIHALCDDDINVKWSVIIINVYVLVCQWVLFSDVCHLY